MKLERDLRYIQNMNDEDKTVQMLLYGEIGATWGESDSGRMVNGYDFAAELHYLHDNGYKVEVRINSPGGQIIPGFSIVDAILRTESDTIAVGIAASMAGVILQAGKVRKMTDFASVMIHGISGIDGDESDFPAILNAQLRHLLTTKSKLQEEEISEIMDSGKDHWFAVKGVQKHRHALEAGIVDEVLVTNKKFSPEILANRKTPEKLVAVYNKLLDKEMEFTRVKNALKLDANASEEAVLEAVNNAISKSQENELKVKQLEATNKKLSDELQAITDERVEALVNAAKEKNYPQDQVENLRDFAGSNFDAAEALVNSFQGATPQDPKDEPKKQTPAAMKVPKVTPSNSQEPKAKTYAEYMASAEGEKEFYNLKPEEQSQVLAAAGA